MWELPNGVNYYDCIVLMNSFKAVLNSENLIYVENAYDRCIENSVAREYEKLLRHVQGYHKFKGK